MNADAFARTLASQTPDLEGAACAGRAGLWDGQPDGRNGGREIEVERIRRHHEAACICRAQCPVRVECLHLRLTSPAMRHDEGIYGGHLFDTRGMVPLEALPVADSGAPERLLEAS